MDVRIERVQPELTLPLRWRVLRAHLDQSQMAPWPGERDPQTLHLAARTPDGEVIGAVVLIRQPFELMPDVPDAWRLRGMATDERLRGRGIGDRVLRAAIGEVAGRGGGLLWCNARVSARRFYERAGFMAIGAEWDIPHSGPHVAMWRQVPAEAAELEPAAG